MIFMAFITFNDISSYDIPVNILELSLAPRGKQRTTTEYIPGKEESITIVKNEYENISINVKFEIKKDTDIRNIYSWINSSGRLITSDEPDKYYMAVASKEIARKRVNSIYSSITIQFECKPFARAINPTIIDLTSAASYTLINNAGTVKGKPIITLKPSGTKAVTISINGEDFVVEIPEAVSTNGYAITIDSELMIAYYTDTNGNKISCTEYTTGHFPLLHVDDNYIKHSGGVNEMTINMNERWY